MMPSPYSCCQLLALLAAMVYVLLLWRPARAAEYLVRDDYGWALGNDYEAWARDRSFAAGDVLVFQYEKGQHNVYEVTEEAYRTCDATVVGTVLATYNSGLDRITLRVANRTYWFICQFPDHCITGMRLAVKVPRAGSPVESPPPIGTPPTIGLPPTIGTSAAVSQSWTAWGGLVMIGVAHVLVN